MGSTRARDPGIQHGPNLELQPGNYRPLQLTELPPRARPRRAAARAAKSEVRKTDNDDVDKKPKLEPPPMRTPPPRIRGGNALPPTIRRGAGPWSSRRGRNPRKALRKNGASERAQRRIQREKEAGPSKRPGTAGGITTQVRRGGRGPTVYTDSLLTGLRRGHAQEWSASGAAPPPWAFAFALAFGSLGPPFGSNFGTARRCPSDNTARSLR